MAQSKPVNVTHITEPMVKATTLVLAQPFDLARSVYALAVRFGLIVVPAMMMTSQASISCGA